MAILEATGGGGVARRQDPRNAYTCRVGAEGGGCNAAGTALAAAAAAAAAAAWLSCGSLCQPTLCLALPRLPVPARSAAPCLAAAATSPSDADNNSLGYAAVALAHAGERWPSGAQLQGGLGWEGRYRAGARIMCPAIAS